MQKQDPHDRQDRFYWSQKLHPALPVHSERPDLELLLKLVLCHKYLQCQSACTLPVNPNKPLSRKKNCVVRGPSISDLSLKNMYFRVIQWTNSEVYCSLLDGSNSTCLLKMALDLRPNKISKLIIKLLLVNKTVFYILKKINVRFLCKLIKTAANQFIESLPA